MDSTLPPPLSPGEHVIKVEKLLTEGFNQQVTPKKSNEIDASPLPPPSGGGSGGSNAETDARLDKLESIVKTVTSSLTSLSTRVKDLEDNNDGGSGGGGGGGDTSELDERITTLETAIGSSASGIIKDLATLNTLVGNESSGLVKDIQALQSTVGGNTSGIVKDVNDLKTFASQVDSNFSTISNNITSLEDDLNDATNEIATKLTKRTTYANGDWEMWYSESDGGGHWFWTKATNTLSFEGFNNDPSSKIVWERYIIDGGGENYSTSGGTRIGTRLIVAWDGAALGQGRMRYYYTIGKANSTYTADDEVASQIWIRTLIAGELGRPIPAVATHDDLLSITGMRVNDWTYVDDDTHDGIHVGETWAYAYDGTQWVVLAHINELQIQEDDITLTIDAVSGKRKIKEGGIGVAQLSQGAATDAIIGNRTLADQAASSALLPIASKSFTSWLQGLRNNLKYLLSNHQEPIYADDDKVLLAPEVDGEQPRTMDLSRFDRYRFGSSTYDEEEAKMGFTINLGELLYAPYNSCGGSATIWTLDKTTKKVRFTSLDFFVTADTDPENRLQDFVAVSGDTPLLLCYYYDDNNTPHIWFRFVVDTGEAAKIEFDIFKYNATGSERVPFDSKPDIIARIDVPTATANWMAEPYTIDPTTIDSDQMLSKDSIAYPLDKISGGHAFVYIDSDNGDDSNDGYSETTAFESIPAAVQAANKFILPAGAIVNFRIASKTTYTLPADFEWNLTVPFHITSKEGAAANFPVIQCSQNTGLYAIRFAATPSSREAFATSPIIYMGGIKFEVTFNDVASFPEASALYFALSNVDINSTIIENKTPYFCNAIRAEVCNLALIGVGIKGFNNGVYGRGVETYIVSSGTTSVFSIDVANAVFFMAGGEVRSEFSKTSTYCSFAKLFESRNENGKYRPLLVILNGVDSEVGIVPKTVDGVRANLDSDIPISIEMTKAEYDALEDPPGSGLYPALAGKQVTLTDVFPENNKIFPAMNTRFYNNNVFGTPQTTGGELGGGNNDQRVEWTATGDGYLYIRSHIKGTGTAGAGANVYGDVLIDAALVNIEGGPVGPTDTEKTIYFSAGPFIMRKGQKIVFDARTDVASWTAKFSGTAFGHFFPVDFIATPELPLSLRPVCPFPVNYIYMTIDPINPAALWPGTTWSKWGSGRVPVGVDPEQTEFDTVEKEDGEKAHTLSVAEMPSHNHGSTMVGGGVVAQGVLAGSPGLQFVGTTYTGGSGAHNNLQPYITCYMWKRTE
jgi:hypothetical protein